MNKKQARKAVLDAGIKPVNGRVYIIYDCGHVSDQGTERVFYRTRGTTVRKRACSHKDCEKIYGFMVMKYKKCKCGAEHIGLHINPGVSCSACKHRVKHPKKHLMNKDQANPKRWNCRHRSKCLITYMRYEAIPCKPCMSYRAFKEAI